MTAMPPDCPVTALGYSLDYATGERIHHFRTPGFDVAKIPTNRVAALVELLFDRHIAVAAELWPPREPRAVVGIRPLVIVLPRRVLLGDAEARRQLSHLERRRLSEDAPRIWGTRHPISAERPA